MKKRGVVYLNGRCVREDKALVSVFDRGFTYGDGLFETMKAQAGSVAFKKEHLARLKKGIRALRINISAIKPLFDDINNGALEALLEKNRLDNACASLRISVTRGVSDQWQGHAPSPSCRPTTVITTKPIDAKAIALCQKQGVAAVYITGYAPLTAGIKSLNFLPNVLGKGEAIRRGAMEGIFIGKDGLISEGTSSNLFIVKDNVLKTPLSGPGAALPGIMAAKVHQAAARLDIMVKVSRIRASDLESADESFITNSILEVVPLIRIEKKTISNAKRGALTALIQKHMGLP
ncbi:MAG: aminotransferase class IV [Deltaproteobacteria bacterium]|nr:aminotransferase class IV [Deltaproteobacteria bacterium]